MLKETFEAAAAFVISIKDIFREFSFKKYLFALFVTFTTLFLLVMFFENLTGYYYFGRIEKKLNALIKISNTAAISQENKNAINKEYNSLLQDIGNYNIDKSLHITIPNKIISLTDEQLDTVYKFLSGFILPLLVVLANLKNRAILSGTILGSALLGLIFGIIAIFIPTIWKLWINLIGIPVLQIVLIVPIVLSQQKKIAKEAAKKREALVGLNR